MTHYAQKTRASNGTQLNTDRISVSLAYIPNGSGTCLDACTPIDNPRVRECVEEAGYAYLPVDITGDGKQVQQEDLRQLSLKDKSISLIFSVDTLEHIQELDLALSEMYRVLKDGGVLVAHVPAYFFSRSDSPEIDATNDPYGHVRYFSGPDLANRLFEKGFVPLRIGYNLDYGAAIVCATKNEAVWSDKNK